MILINIIILYFEQITRTDDFPLNEYGSKVIVASHISQEQFLEGRE